MRRKARGSSNGACESASRVHHLRKMVDFADGKQKQKKKKKKSENGSREGKFRAGKKLVAVWGTLI